MKYYFFVRLSLVALASLLFIGDAAEAAPKKKRRVSSKAAMSDGAPYGMAGCGVGSLIISYNGKGAQIGAFFLNGLSSLQSSALSSGLSNCVESRTSVAAMEQSVYMSANFNSLSKEAAQGGGEHLNGLAEVLGCRGDAERLRLGYMSQERYDEIFSTQEPDGVLDNYISAIQSDPLLAEQCVKAS